jgi:alkylation response protein AidB-like acyl-CoA dehydrogenase
MLNLDFSDDRKLLRDSFLRFFDQESTVDRVRAAEPLGFDPALHSALGDMGVFGLRAPGSVGGSGLGLIDAALVAEAAGRHLASAPVVEGMIVGRLLAEVTAPAEWLEKHLLGRAVTTLALHEAKPGVAQVVPAGAVADAILGLSGDELFLLRRPCLNEAAPNHGSQPIARLILTGEGSEGERTTLAKGPAARDAYRAAIEEWKLLTAAQLNGLARRALEHAVDYARERVQFGRPIGSYQAIAHPLADRAVDVDAAQLLTWWTIHEIAKNSPDAGALICMTFWRSALTASETASRAMHTFGGYGVTVDYDVQLFFRRAKALALVYGDPQRQLAEAGSRMWLGLDAPIPDAGDPDLDFDFGAEAEALAEEVRDVLRPIAPQTQQVTAVRSYEAFDPEISAALGARGLFQPSWPEEWGGRAAHPYAAALALATIDEFPVATQPQSANHFIGSVIRMFGDLRLKHEVLPGMARGTIFAVLGFSEPGSGSDIFAARTRAEWHKDRQQWIINGQKMFTTGAERAQYIFVLARTDPDAAKHAGITMFLVPTVAPGVEVRPILTMQEESTNATFYSDVLLKDHYRVGEVNGGLKVLGAALVLEQGSIYRSGWHDLVDIALDWARKTVDGRIPIEEAEVRARIARTKVNAILRELLGKRSLYHSVSDPARRNSFGPMSKLFYSEALQRDLSDLLDLLAPDTLFHDLQGVGKLEIGYRLAQVGTIYGGTSEVQRSSIAEVGLGLPRSR